MKDNANADTTPMDGYYASCCFHWYVACHVDPHGWGEMNFWIWQSELKKEVHVGPEDN